MENGCNLFDGADQPGLLSADTLTVYTHNAAGVRGGSVGFAVPAPVQSQFPPSVYQQDKERCFSSLRPAQTPDTSYKSNTITTPSTLPSSLSAILVP